MTDRKRDLGGFADKAVVPPPRRLTHTDSTAQPTLPTPPSTPREGATKPSSVRRARPAAKQRITLSLPTEIAGWLKQESEDTDRYYLDIILGAFASGRPFVEAEFRRGTNDSNLGIRPLKRRREPGRVQVALLIPASDLQILDAAATAVRLDRSSYVAELLSLAQPD